MFLEPQVLLRVQRTASAAITANRAVKLDADKTTVSHAGSNDWVFGIAENATTFAGDEVTVAILGLVPVACQAAVAAGAELNVTTTGRVSARGTTATTLYNCIGRAMTDTNTLGDHVMVNLFPFATFGANAA